MLYNMREYHRPTDINEAIRLLQRPDVRTVALAGGVSVVGEGTSAVEAVVDLGDLGLDFVEHNGAQLRLGATVKLQTIMDELTSIASGVLSDAARRMAGWNIRNVATLGGSLASGGVHTPLSVVLAALDAAVTIFDGQSENTTSWIDLSETIRRDGLPGRLITAITLDGAQQVSAAYEQVARTPADHPIVSAAASVRRASNGQTEAIIAVGGLLHRLVVVRGISDPSAFLDGATEFLSQNASDSDYQSNYLGSAEYRRAMAPVLAHRALTAALRNAR